MNRTGPYIVTYTGRKFYPLNPRPGDFDPLDIAVALANICRWGGHTSRFYAVSEHSTYVADMVRHLGGTTWPKVGWALLHDAAEAYVGDVVRPLKNTLAFTSYKQTEAKILAAIAEQFGLPPDMPPVVHQCDEYALVCEARALIKNGAELVPEVRKHQWDELTSMFPERLLTPPNTHFPRGDWLGQFNFAWDNR